MKYVRKLRNRMLISNGLTRNQINVYVQSINEEFKLTQSCGEPDRFYIEGEWSSSISQLHADLLEYIDTLYDNNGDNR